MKRGSYVKKTSTERYKKLLPELKEEFDNKNISSVFSLMRNKKISNTWGTFLKKNNIIYKNELGYWKWNDKIPVSSKLIQSFRDLKKEQNLTYRSNKEKQQPTLFDKPKTNKRRNVKIEFKDKQQQELGLIRRFWRKFWRWIY